MFVFISAGKGVDEVCRAVWHFYQWLKKEDFTFEVLTLETNKGQKQIKSLLLYSNDERFLALQGTQLWKSQSPFRPKHKRKNWYFSLEIEEEPKTSSIDPKAIVYQSMKSPKKGGQHVNSTCSGIRAVYKPLGIDAISYDERSQHQNKKIALFRLLQKLKKVELDKEKSQQQQRWKQSKNIQRGNAILIFEGEGFKKVITL